MDIMWDIKSKYAALWRMAVFLGKTSSVLDVENDSLTFARSKKWLSQLVNTDKCVHVIIPYNLDVAEITLPSNVVVYTIRPEDDLMYVFTCIHNALNADRDPRPNVISPTVQIHPTAVIGVHGNTYCDCPDGSRMNLKHMGNVIIEDYVDVEALSIVHRAGMSSTILKKGVKICVKCNIGHNCYVGENSIIAPGVLLGGGARIGRNCYIWQGAIISSHISICDDVVIGAGSLVMRDITKSGVYYGAPAKYVKPYRGHVRM